MEMKQGEMLLSRRNRKKAADRLRKNFRGRKKEQELLRRSFSDPKKKIS